VQLTLASDGTDQYQQATTCHDAGGQRLSHTTLDQLGELRGG
jgi:hypothetical protein